MTKTPEHVRAAERLDRARHTLNAASAAVREHSRLIASFADQIAYQAREVSVHAIGSDRRKQKPRLDEIRVLMASLENELRRKSGALGTLRAAERAYERAFADPRRFDPDGAAKLHADIMRQAAANRPSTHLRRVK